MSMEAGTPRDVWPDYCLKCNTRHPYAICPLPTAKATGAMRSREEWAQWLRGIKPDIMGKADFILSALAAERERARKEALESIRAFAKGGLAACAELDDKDGAAAYKSVMDDCDRDLGRLSRLNRQREIVCTCTGGHFDNCPLASKTE